MQISTTAAAEVTATLVQLGFLNKIFKLFKSMFTKDLYWGHTTNINAN